jgi:DNA invertase Pin-like site-specific DNA recombinase
MKVAIYGRVSTIEQNTDNQVIELEQYCKARKYAVYKVYTDQGISGSKESRPAFDQMMKDAYRRQFDVLLIWKLDRLSRSLKHLLNTLDTLNSLNISFISYSDNFDTTTPQGRLMFQLVGAFAEFERSLIRERVILGLKRAKLAGKKLGRPKLNLNKEIVLKLRQQGKSLREIGKTLNISRMTISRALKHKAKSLNKNEHSLKLCL